MIVQFPRANVGEGQLAGKPGTWPGFPASWCTHKAICEVYSRGERI